MLSMTITTPSHANDKVRIEFERSGIPAALVDQGDYYHHPDGRAIKFYRKKDVYVIEKKRSAKAINNLSSMQRIKAQFGARVKLVEKHQLGSLEVVRIDNRAVAKKTAI